MVPMCLVRDQAKRWNLLKHIFFEHAKSLGIYVKNDLLTCHSLGIM